MNKQIDWKLQSEIINQYSDWEIKPTRKAVLEYIKTIIEINGGTEFLFSNEKAVLTKIGGIEILK